LLGCPISDPSLLAAFVLNQGPFPPPALPGFPGTTGLSATSLRPDHSVTGIRSAVPDHAARLPVLRALSLCTCCRHYPGTAASGPSLLIRPAISAFPERVVGSACASSFSRLARRSLALRPAHSRSHQFVARFTQRLQPVRHLSDCSGCFRLEHVAGWDSHPLESAALSRRTPLAVVPRPSFFLVLSGVPAGSRVRSKRSPGVSRSRQRASLANWADSSAALHHHLRSDSSPSAWTSTSSEAGLVTKTSNPTNNARCFVPSSAQPV